MVPHDVVTSTYLACLVETVGLYSGATPSARPLSALGPAPGPDAAADEPPTATLVRFGEERVWGSSLLIADGTSVLGLCDLPDADPSDWLGELNNQLVGRMKNRLLRSSVNLQISPPVPVVGFTRDRRAVVGWEVEWAGGRLTACLGLTVAPGVAFETDDAVEVAAEGTLCLF